MENDFNVDLKEATRHRKQLPSAMLGALSKREEELLKEDETPKVMDLSVVTLSRSERRRLRLKATMRTHSSNGTLSFTASTKRKHLTSQSSARSCPRQNCS